MVSTHWSKMAGCREVLFFVAQILSASITNQQWQIQPSTIYYPGLRKMKRDEKLAAEENARTPTLQIVLSSCPTLGNPQYKPHPKLEWGVGQSLVLVNPRSLSFKHSCSGRYFRQCKFIHSSMSSHSCFVQARCFPR